MWVKHFKIQKIAMPKHRSARKSWLVLGFEHKPTEQQGKDSLFALYVFEFWYLLPSQAQLRAEKYHGQRQWRWIIHQEAPSSRMSAWAAAHITFSEHFWRGCVLRACLVFRTEQPLKNFMHSLKAIFHLQSRGPQLSDRLFLLSFQSTVNCGNYHKRTGP